MRPVNLIWDWHDVRLQRGQGYAVLLVEIKHWSYCTRFSGPQMLLNAFQLLHTCHLKAPNLCSCQKCGGGLWSKRIEVFFFPFRDWLNLWWFNAWLCGQRGREWCDQMINRQHIDPDLLARQLREIDLFCCIVVLVWQKWMHIQWCKSAASFFPTIVTMTVYFWNRMIGSWGNWFHPFLCVCFFSLFFCLKTCLRTNTDV